MTKPPDDLEAVREIASTLEPFQAADRERIIRWARERLGMAAPAASLQLPGPLPASGSAAATPGTTPPATDIKSFIKAKNPKNDTQLAATVAYFYRFTAPEGERKDAISGPDLLEACRLADWKRPARAAQTMVNAFGAGVFDKAGTGSYRLNSVGENLVAMVLPGDGTSQARPAKTKPKTPRKGAKKGKSAARSQK